MSTFWIEKLKKEGLQINSYFTDIINERNQTMPVLSKAYKEGKVGLDKNSNLEIKIEVKKDKLVGEFYTEYNFTLKLLNGNYIKKAEELLENNRDKLREFYF